MVAVDAETADLLGVLAVMVSMSNSVKYTYMQRKKEKKTEKTLYKHEKWTYKQSNKTNKQKHRQKKEHETEAQHRYRYTNFFHSKTSYYYDCFCFSFKYTNITNATDIISAINICFAKVYFVLASSAAFFCGT